jgi:hypothetical protein
MNLILIIDQVAVADNSDDRPTHGDTLPEKQI